MIGRSIAMLSVTPAAFAIYHRRMRIRGDQPLDAWFHPTASVSPGSRSARQESNA